jgi:Mn-dependent DtxR family transcriptional regulator
MTDRERQALQFIRTFQKANRRSPSMSEIADHLGVSKSRVQQLLLALDHKGEIQRENGDILFPQDFVFRY